MGKKTLKIQGLTSQHFRLMGSHRPIIYTFPFQTAKSMKHVLPLHTAIENTACETYLLNVHFPQRLALVMVNVSLSEPCLTGPLAVLGENKSTPSREGEAAGTRLVLLQSGVGSAPWLSLGSQESPCPEEGLMSPSWNAQPFSAQVNSSQQSGCLRCGLKQDKPMVIYVPAGAKDLQPPLEAECYPVKGRVNGRLLLPVHYQPGE